ncbi:MAG TPA: M20/M25/M40 family metallo-hydrolase [Solirubrobacteraceae bacterium]
MSVDPWVERSAADIARRAERELEALVAISSPSGDRQGAEECLSVCAVMAPDEASIERVPCSSPGHADDLIARLSGTGSRRILLLGHVDTVIAHADHRPLERDGGKLVGSGSVDMKGGDVLALGVLRALVERRADFAEAALLLVCDEEWRTSPFAHGPRFAGWDACLCFEAGERTDDGAEGIVVRRKAAGTVRVTARGRAAHSGSAPDRGRNALLALAAAAQAIAARHDPDGPAHLTAVPTVLRSGDAFNVVPDAGHLYCDVRADDLAAIHEVVHAVPGEVGGAGLATEMVRLWPGMDATATTGALIERATAALGRPVAGVRRGGASDASHFAGGIPVTVDGLGPRGGLAHNPGEFVLASSLPERAEVALAVADAALAGD